MSSNTETTETEELSEAEIAEEIIDMVNSRFDHTEFNEEISGSHRYLQQEFFNQVIRPAIINLAEQPTDARNERAVDQCQQIVDEMNWSKNNLR